MKRQSEGGTKGDEWVFFSNHWYVLLVISSDPGARMRDIAHRVGITERSTHSIIRDLVDAGFVEVEKQGRRNRYRLTEGARFRHPLIADSAVAPVLELLRHRTT